MLLIVPSCIAMLEGKKVMILKGWHRLWVFLSLIYMCIIVVYCFIEFPKPERLVHKNEFYKELSKQSLAMVHESGPWDDYAQQQAPPVCDGNYLDRLAGIKVAKRATRSEWDKATPIPTVPDTVKVEMPNGHIIVFSNKFKKAEIESASNEYWSIIENKANKERIYFIWYAFLFWSIPCIGLYLLGRGIRWVYQGFKSN
ncbi:MAG: hypothetical protein L6300_01545 [Syntrophaceae bacterium]|nr:hypothetical protein [Pseudomonadota bacterium]MCG2738909.1 hypothetical protein [Syntrophaceae bacterium]